MSTRLGAVHHNFVGMSVLCSIYKKYADCINTKYAAEIWYRIAQNQLPHLVPQGSGHMDGAYCWQPDGRGNET